MFQYIKAHIINQILLIKAPYETWDFQYTISPNTVINMDAASGAFCTLNIWDNGARYPFDVVLYRI